MAGASEILIRIHSIAETRKVTDAMYMISSVKMRRAKRGLDSTIPYFDTLREEIGELLLYFPNLGNRYFRRPGGEGTGRRALAVITADKGLAGPYNQNVIKLADLECARDPGTLLFPIGEYGRQHFISRKLDTAEGFFSPAAFPTLAAARNICGELLEYYSDGRVDRIDIIYTDFLGGAGCRCRTQCLLPLELSEFKADDAAPLPFGKQYLPDPDTVLEGIVPSYLTGFLYGAMVESYCSEQSARMEAMKTAGNNADRILRELRIRYNTVRQAAITAEITEITAGANALRRQAAEEETPE
jgi:F-type H+-transporting ATPase subunit gamma